MIRGSVNVMQILINISNKAYEYSKNRTALFLDVNTEILNAVKNGTVLPKKHGDLVVIIPATKGE